MLDDKTLTMASAVVADPVIVAPVIKPPAVASFTLKIDVTPLLSPPLPMPSPPPVPPPLPTPLMLEPIPLIAPPPSPSGSVADKEDDAVVEFHQKKWKEYVEVPYLTKNNSFKIKGFSRKWRGS